MGIKVKMNYEQKWNVGDTFTECGDHFMIIKDDLCEYSILDLSTGKHTDTYSLISDLMNDRCCTKTNLTCVLEV